jgi:uncharacterized protein (TIGR04255 family)
MVTELRFKDPPVREVALTVFFDKISTLQTINLARLRVAWLDAYPNVKEVPPRPPLRGDRSFAEFLGSNSFWPMPSTTFADESGRHAIQLQADRFGIVWNFAKFGEGYPGYMKLSAEVMSRFGEFKEVVAQELDENVKVTDVDLEYTNEVESLSPEELVLGILTNWQASELSVERANLAGLRLHYCTNMKPDDTTLDITVDPLFESVANGGCTLEIKVTASVSSQDEVGSRMNSAHDVLVEKFLSILNDDMRRRWGLHDG